MATISSAGIGSGLDVQSIVSQLVAIERRPLAQLQTQGSQLSSRISTWGTIRSQLSSLQDAARALSTTTNWNARTFTSSNTTALSGGASSAAAVGSYSIEVSALAQQQVIRTSSGLASDTAIGQSGTLEITTGTWSGTTFTPSGSSVTLSVSGAETLSDIARNINNLNAGVTATVVRSGGQDNLILRGTETGAAQGFQVRAFDDGAPQNEITSGSGLGALAYSSQAGSFFGMTMSQAAQNASATIEGISVTSPNNTLADTVSGLTLQLSATTTSPVTVTVAEDLSDARGRIQRFVDAFNTLVTSLAQFTRFDQATQTAGPLQGDSTAVGMLNTLRRMVGSTGPDNNMFSRMSDVGLELQRNGTLSINNSRLGAALENMNELREFFSATSADPTTSGLARRFSDYAFGALATQGPVGQRTNALQRSVERNNQAIDRLNDRLQRTEARLFKTYSALDTQIANLNSLNQFVTQQIATWNQARR